MDRKRQHSRAVTSPLPEEEGLGEKVEPSLAKEGRGGSKKQHRRAVTSFPFMVKGKAWLGIKDPPVGEDKWGKNYCFSESSARFRLIPSFSEFPSVEARWLLILAHQKAPLTEGGELWLAFLFPYLPHAPFPKPYL